MCLLIYLLFVFRREQSCYRCTKDLKITTAAATTTTAAAAATTECRPFVRHCHHVSSLSWLEGSSPLDTIQSQQYPASLRVLVDWCCTHWGQSSWHSGQRCVEMMLNVLCVSFHLSMIWFVFNIYQLSSNRCCVIDTVNIWYL